MLKKNFNSVLIIGMGLIGSSLFRAIYKNHLICFDQKKVICLTIFLTTFQVLNFLKYTINIIRNFKHA